MTFTGLANAVERKLDDFDGSPMWCVTTVKLDLEGRGVIERLPARSPQWVRLAEQEREQSTSTPAFAALENRMT